MKIYRKCPMCGQIKNIEVADKLDPVCTAGGGRRMRVGEFLKMCDNKFITVAFQRDDESFMGCYIYELTDEDLQTEFKSFHFEYVIGRPTILFNV